MKPLTIDELRASSPVRREVACHLFASIPAQEWILKIKANDLCFSFCRAIVIANDLAMRCARKFVSRSPRTIACVAIYLSGFFLLKDLDKFISQQVIRHTVHALFHVASLHDKQVTDEFRAKYWTELGLPVLQRPSITHFMSPDALILQFLRRKTTLYHWTLPQIAKGVGRNPAEVGQVLQTLLDSGRITSTACFGKKWYAAKRT